MPGLLILFAVAAALIVTVGTAAAIQRLTHPPRLTYGAALARRLPTAPGELGLRFAEREWRLSDGAATPAWVIDGGDPAGPVVVVSHGWGDGRYGMLLPAPLLVPHAAALVLYDLRGHGESRTTRSHLATTEVDDLLAIVEQLDAELEPALDHRPRRFVLMGASMGAGISIAAAARAGEKVAGVIADGPYRRGMEPVEGFFRLKRLPVQPFNWLIGAHLAFWYASPGEFDRCRHASLLRCPLLVLHGARDPICRVESAREIAAAAPAATVVVFEEGGHLDLATRFKERYREALADFFARIRLERAGAEAGAITVPEERRRPTPPSGGPSPSEGTGGSETAASGDLR